MNYQPLVHFDLRDLTQQLLIMHSCHYSVPDFYDSRDITAVLYFEPGDLLVVTSEHVLRCGGLMGCNHCKRANLTNLRRCPHIPVAAFNHLLELA